MHPKFTLSYGVRMDYDAEPSPLQHNAYFSPRIGFAWDPFGDQKTVIRAGSGIFVAPVNFQVDYLVNILNDSGNYINQIFKAISSPGVNAATIYGYGLRRASCRSDTLTQADLSALGLTVGPGGAGRVIFNIAPNYKNTYSIQNSLSIARQLSNSLSLEVGYQMYKGVHIQLDQETNFYETGKIDPMWGPQVRSHRSEHHAEQHVFVHRQLHVPWPDDVVDQALQPQFPGAGQLHVQQGDRRQHRLQFAVRVVLPDAA